MPGLIRSMRARLRALVGDRRDSPRRKVQRRAGLVFHASILGTKAARALKPLDLKGYTRDISESGLALVVTGQLIDESYLAGRTLLEVRLELPGAPVVMRARPVRYERVDVAGEEAERGTLICVRITGMEDRDRAYYTKYLRRVEKHEEKQQLR